MTAQEEKTLKATLENLMRAMAKQSEHINLLAGALNSLHQRVSQVEKAQHEIVRLQPVRH